MTSTQQVTNKYLKWIKWLSHNINIPVSALWSSISLYVFQKQPPWRLLDPGHKYPWQMEIFKAMSPAPQQQWCLLGSSVLIVLDAMQSILSSHRAKDSWQTKSEWDCHLSPFSLLSWHPCGWLINIKNKSTERRSTGLGSGWMVDGTHEQAFRFSFSLWFHSCFSLSSHFVTKRPVSQSSPYISFLGESNFPGKFRKL